MNNLQCTVKQLQNLSTNFPLFFVNQTFDQKVYLNYMYLVITKKKKNQLLTNFKISEFPQLSPNTKYKVFLYYFYYIYKHTLT